MAYMRGEWYIYSDGTHMCIHHGGIEGTLAGSFVAMPMDTFDELVAMRWHRLSAEEQQETMTRAFEKYAGNFGADGLATALGEPTVMESIAAKLEKDDSDG